MEILAECRNPRMMGHGLTGGKNVDEREVGWTPSTSESDLSTNEACGGRSDA